MLHLTLTGAAAGHTVCGHLVQRNGDRYQHVAYDPRAIAAQLADPDMCPACKAEWEAE